MQEYGYSIEGTPATCYRKYSPWGPRYNVIAAISTEGIVAIRIFDAGVTVGAEEFVAFIQNDLHPALNRYDGASNRSVVILGMIYNRYIYYYGNYQYLPIYI